MNLGKLLATGKSIINGCQAISYRANKRVYLPKFGPAQNPFQSPASAEAARPGPEAATALSQKVVPVAAKTQKIPSWPPGPTRASSWAGKLNPVSYWRNAPEVEARRPAVQSELLLDAVKVVHNDLSDADVAVVPVKSRAPEPAAIPELPPPSRPWEFLAERMFHATVD
jgi:hypothetical protein